MFSPSEKTKELIKEGALIVDVRSPEEFASGHTSGSINLPLPELSGELERLKGKKVILVCRSGMRASSAQNLLQKNGIIAHNAGSWHSVNLS